MISPWNWYNSEKVYVLKNNFSLDLNKYKMFFCEDWFFDGPFFTFSILIFHKTGITLIDKKLVQFKFKKNLKITSIFLNSF